MSHWVYDDDGNHLEYRESDEDGFKQFMLDNEYEVHELCELAIENS